MRISTNQGDAGYHWAASSGLFTAFLDGERVQNCTMADDEAGEVEVYVMRDGKIVIKDEDVLREIKKGKVEIEIVADLDGQTRNFANLLLEDIRAGRL